LAILYFLLSQIAYFFIRIAALWNNKLALGIQGRKDQKAAFEKEPFKGEWIWMHCSSLGEFEQGRPVLEAIRHRYPEIKIALTFFSPSGYEIRKSYEGADYIAYLPFDSPGNAKKWLDKIRPRLAIFVKYDLWYYYLKSLSYRQTPRILISAKFSPKHRFFKWYGGFSRKMLLSFSTIFVQDDLSKRLLLKKGYKEVIIAGDNRIDRVAQIAISAKKYPILDRFIGNHPVLVCGSTWPPDEDALLALFQSEKFKNWKAILAPHDISLAHMQQITEKLTVSNVKYSQVKDAHDIPQKVMVIDNIGMLSSLYQYGKIAYIGGGFGTGLHNTLEPIAFGLPVIFGPKYHKFEESVYLVEKGGGFSIQNKEALLQIFEKLQNPEVYKNASAVATDFLENNKGATEMVMKWIAIKVPALKPYIE
jgi:3-deoxy-D-manno-octulosonic-acid transferase